MGLKGDGVQGASLPLEELVLHLPPAPSFLPAGSAPLPASIHGLCSVEDGAKWPRAGIKPFLSWLTRRVKVQAAKINQASGEVCLGQQMGIHSSGDHGSSETSGTWMPWQLWKYC